MADRSYSYELSLGGSLPSSLYPYRVSGNTSLTGPSLYSSRYLSSDPLFSGTSSSRFFSSDALLHSESMRLLSSNPLLSSSAFLRYRSLPDAESSHFPDGIRFSGGADVSGIDGSSLGVESSLYPKTARFALPGKNELLGAGVELAAVGMKRNAEALYRENIAGSSANTIAESDGLLTANAIAKHPRMESTSNLPTYPQRPGENECSHYMLTRTCKFGDKCKFDHPLWVPEGGIPEWKEVMQAPVVVSLSLPERPGEPDCPYFMKTQKCKFGQRCKYNHPRQQPALQSLDVPAVVNVLGEEAVVPVPPALLNSQGLPIRQGEGHCLFYVKNGRCKFGPACRFSHPELTTVSVDLDSISSQVSLPTSAIASIGTAIPNSSLNTPPTFYPQRPGMLACDYYMKTGICKFAERCKFHHPIDHATTSAVQPVKLTLAGFPRREDQPICPFYLKTGICKFGANCKFDHPPPMEMVAKAVASVTKKESEHDDSREKNA